MYRLYFAERDATLYERHPERNTGHDGLLQLIKHGKGERFEDEIRLSTYNSRILLDFGAQVTAITNAVNAGTIPPIGRASNSASVYLNIRAASANSLPANYTVYAYPVSESWSEGTGTYIDNPESKLGVSWYYRTGTDVSSVLPWNTGSGHSRNQTSSTNVGGGTWITGSGYEASQSFANAELADIRMDVTDIVKQWVDGTITNNGFILKRLTSDEVSADVLGEISFFGKDTNTIYVPRLEVAWDDSVLTGTGSFTEISADIYSIYFKNIRDSYRETEKTKFKLGVRPAYPSKTYQTASFYDRTDRLTTSSFYSIKDAVTDETIIPFDETATRISCDSDGNYFRIDLNTFMPERYYKIVIKVERDGGDDVQIHDNGYYFKVVR
jgi:hypothetical protein